VNFKCPYCSRECNFVEVIAEGDIKSVIMRVPKFGKHANIVMTYCELFGISPLKKHTKKLLLLINEMAKLFEMESFNYHKKSYRISRDGIADAINKTVHHSFPDDLTSHNYLKKIMIGIAEEEERATGKRAEEALLKREKALKRGTHLDKEDHQDTLKKIKKFNQNL